jgi:hypothetical protein
MLTPHRLAAALAAVALAAGAATAFADDGGRKTVLDSHVFGSRPDGPVLFKANPGGAPWVIGKGEAEVRRDGRVKVRVEGLVIPTPPQNGTNPLPQISATVYCNGAAVASTAPVPFSTDGDARIDQKLGAPLPSPCLVPAVLLNPGANAAVYIAATGE